MLIVRRVSGVVSVVSSLTPQEDVIAEDTVNVVHNASIPYAVVPSPCAATSIPQMSY